MYVFIIHLSNTLIPFYRNKILIIVKSISLKKKGAGDSNNAIQMITSLKYLAHRKGKWNGNCKIQQVHNNVPLA